MLDYAVVVATRNRQDILGTALRTFASQSRPPARIVVVDRSDDHAAVARIVSDVAANTTIPVSVHYGEAANLPLQRNQGLRHVTEAITMFPDDDVLWFPDTAASVMDVYDADERGLYGAVTAVDAYVSPVALGDGTPTRRSRLTDHPTIMRTRNAVEAALIPQPFEVFGRSRSAALEPAARSAGLTHPLVGTFGGYRMTLRTHVARALAFDPVLGSRVGYGVHEDKDMALRVLASGCLIAVAESARAFHNTHPGKRAAGFSYGFFHILNYAYVSHKVFPPEDRALAALDRYLRYKLTLYGLRRRDQYDRDVAAGARAAYGALPALLGSLPDESGIRYEQICRRSLDGR